MYWCNYFRDDYDDLDERDFLNDEFEEISAYCPFRELLMENPSWFNYMNRQPDGMKPYNPPQGTPPMDGSMPFGPPKQGIPPMGGGNTPPGPPPAMIPSEQKIEGKFAPQPKFVNPGSLRLCVFKYVYIWPRRGRGYWAWLTQVGRRSASGYRWNGRRWVYFGIDLREIRSFVCY